MYFYLNKYSKGCGLALDMSDRQSQVQDLTNIIYLFIYFCWLLFLQNEMKRVRCFDINISDEALNNR